MAATKSTQAMERELYGPSMTEIVLGATLSVLLGGVLAAMYLISKPVEMVRSIPDEPVPNQVYYIAGANSGGGQWLRKKQMLVEGESVELRLSENELNKWVASAKAKDGATETRSMFTPRGINFRIHDDRMQIAMPADFSLGGFNRALIVQADGVFEPEGDGFRYTPDRLMVGSLALHKLPVISGLVYRQLVATQEISDDLAAAWSSLSAVSIEGDTLVLERL